MAIPHSGKCAPREDEKRVETANGRVWWGRRGRSRDNSSLHKCTPKRAAEWGARGSRERKMSSNQNHMRKNGEQCVTRVILLNEKQEQSPFAGAQKWSCLKNGRIPSDDSILYQVAKSARAGSFYRSCSPGRRAVQSKRQSCGTGKQCIQGWRREEQV